MEDQAFVINEAKGSGQGPAIASNVKLHERERRGNGTEDSYPLDIASRIQGKSKHTEFSPFHLSESVRKKARD